MGIENDFLKALKEVDSNSNLKSSDPYQKDALVKYVEIVSNDLESFLNYFTTILNDYPIDISILDMSIEKIISDYQINFTIYLLRNLRLKDNSKLNNSSSFNIFKLKDSKIANNNLENHAAYYEQILGYSLSFEEKKYLKLIMILFIGIKDASSTFFRLFTISKYLKKNDINMSYKKLIYLIGINNMSSLSKINSLLNNLEVPLENKLIEVLSLNTNRDKSGSRGCPFILYKKNLVEKHLITLESFYEKIYVNLSNEKLSISSFYGFKLIYYNYIYDEEKILNFDFINKK